MINLKKQENENEEQYIWRISQANENGLIEPKMSWDELGNLFNSELRDEDEEYTSSTYRKPYQGACKYWENVFKYMLGNQDFIDDLDKKKDDLYKQQVKTSDWLREKRKTLRDEARIEMIIDAIKEDTKKYDIKIKPFSGYTDGTNEAIIAISDWHCGDYVNNFKNKFSLEILQKRIEEVQNETIKYCLQNKVKKLHILNLGDMINGSIHVSARVENEFDTIEQVKQVSRLICNFMANLSEKIEYITYRSTLDNHSRINKDYKEHIEKESFAKLIDWWLSEKIELINLQNKKIINPIEMIYDNIDDNIGLFEINNKSIFFVHGHQDSANNITQSLTFGTDVIADIVVLGHWHTDKVKNFLGKKIYFNGSLKGCDAYALSKRLFSNPSQTLLIFDNKNIIDIPIYVE